MQGKVKRNVRVQTNIHQRQAIWEGSLVCFLGISAVNELFQNLTIFKVSKAQKSYEILINFSQGCQCVLQQVFVWCF